MRARLVEWRAGRRRRPPRRSTSWRSQALDQSRAAISRLISRRGRSARPAADFSVRGVFLIVHSWIRHRQRRARAGGERTNEMPPNVSPDEPDAPTCGAAFNNAWVCYCACARARRAPRLPPSPASVASPLTAALTPPVLLPALRAAPTFQLTRYYRYGELDSCEGRWAAIWACMDKNKRRVRDPPPRPRALRPFVLLDPRRARRSL